MMDAETEVDRRFDDDDDDKESSVAAFQPRCKSNEKINPTRPMAMKDEAAMNKKICTRFRRGWARVKMKGKDCDDKARRWEHFIGNGKSPAIKATPDLHAHQSSLSSHTRTHTLLLTSVARGRTL